MDVRWSRLFVAGCLVLAVVAAGCASEPSTVSGLTPTGDTGPRDDADAGPDVVEEVTPDAPCSPVLAFVSAQAPHLSLDSTANLTVRYEQCDGAPIPDAMVSFAVVGEATDCQLQAGSALTSSNGEATVGLSTGATEVSFEVHASAADAETIAFSVTVSRGAKGTISAELSVDGDDSIFDVYQAFLYDEQDCLSLDPYALAEALQASAEMITLDTRATFEEVLAGSGYTVAALATAAGAPLGFGCTEGVSVSGSETTDVEVVIHELPVVFTGVYDLDSRLDLSDSLPPSVASIVRIFDEMSDDHDLNGDIANESFGLDPAAFLLDFIYRQVCCWEAVGADPDWDSCQAQSFRHPYGDLSALYLRDFTSWSGAQPRVRFLCGSLAIANSAIQQKTQDLILQYIPNVVLQIAALAGDISRAFTEMHILSELTVKGVTADQNGSFTHDLDAMIVEIHDFEGELHVVDVLLSDAGLENLTYTDDASVDDDGRLVIPEHSFQLDFGRLLHYLYMNVILPLLDCDPDWDDVWTPCASTHELFATWVNCYDIAQRVYDAAHEISGGVSVIFVDYYTLVAWCDVGLAAAGDYVEGQIENVVDSTTIVSMGGTCAAGSLSERRQANTLEDGVWEGSLTEDDEYIGDFDGEFTGQRLLEL